MRKTSWEIIITGFIFIGLAFYIMESNSKPELNNRTASAPDSVQLNFGNNQLHVIDIKELDNLKNLQNLNNLENLENLKNLEKLKSLANFMPSEVKTEFIDEINKALKEFDQENVDVQVDIDEGLILIDKVQDITSESWNTISPGVFAYISEFDATSLENSEIKLPYGSITVVGTNSKEAKLTVQASGKISSKDDLQSKIEVRKRVNDRSARFEIKPLSHRNDNIHLQATLNIPVHTTISMITKAGHIESKNITGNQLYNTAGGHITLEDLAGEIEARTSGGHITIANSKGLIVLQSAGGHIRAQDSEGNIKMKTSGGNLQAQNFSGELEASTNGGNIEIQLLNITGQTTANTGAGTITIKIPKNNPAEIDLNGNSVELDSGLNFQGNKSSGNAKGLIGEGGPLIKAKTSYGKVILKAINE